jgi:predicted small lipoprotein YifL
MSVVRFTMMLRHFRIATAAILLLAAAGCGIKGPLVLPPPPAASTEAKPAAPASPPAAAPAASDPAKTDPAAPARKP